MRNRLSFISLLTILLCSHLIDASSKAQAQKVKEVKVILNGGAPINLAQGQSKEIKVSGKNLSVQAIEVTPPGGIILRETKEVVLDPKVQVQMRKGYKLLSLVIDVDSNAQTGDRMMVLVTPEGRTKPQSISVRTHLPTISDLKATVISRSKREIKVEFTFTDEAGDITPEMPPQLLLICDSLFMGKSMSFTRPETLTMKDGKSGTITAITKFTGYGLNVCGLRVTITDKNGNQSDEAIEWIEFK